MKNLLQGQSNEVFYQAKILLDQWQANQDVIRASSLDTVYSQSLWLQLEHCYRAILAEYAGLYNIPAPMSASDIIRQLEQRGLPTAMAERFLEQETDGLVFAIRRQLDARLANAFVADKLVSSVEKCCIHEELEAAYNELRSWLSELRLYSREE